MKTQLKLKSKFSDTKTKAKTKTITKQKTRTKPKKFLEIDLDRIYNPDPSVELAYKQNDAGSYFGYWRDRPEFLNEAKIWTFANAESLGRPKRPIKHQIQSIYRRRVGTKEYCFFLEWLGTKDYFDNPITHTRTCGKFDYPIIVTQQGYNPNSTFDPTQAGPQQLDLSIENIETRYLWEWQDIKQQLIKWKEQKIISDEVVMTAWVANKKYSVATWDMFISLDLESLVLCNRVGEQAYGVFEGDVNKQILAMARESGKERLRKSLSSVPEGRGRKVVA